MEITRFITANQRKVLAKARETYGDKNQLLVSIEELSELMKVCAKYPRYDTKEKAQDALHEDAIDEVSDVLIIMDHVINIFGLTPVEIGDRIEGKIARLNRWLHTSDSMEQTTIDREVPGQEVPGQMRIDQMNDKPRLPCADCKHKGKFDNLKPGGRCIKCANENGSMFEPNTEE